MPGSSRIAVMFLVLLLSACGTTDIDSPEARVTATKDDTFLPYVAVAGKTVQFGSHPETRRIALLARRDRKTGVLTMHASITIGYIQDIRRHYEVARDGRGEKLPLRELSARGAGCRKPVCVHVEDYLVDLPEADVRASQSKGYAFKVFDRTGLEILFQIPPLIVQAVIEAADKMPGPAAPTVAAKKNG